MPLRITDLDGTVFQLRPRMGVTVLFRFRLRVGGVATIREIVVNEMCVAVYGSCHADALENLDRRVVALQNRNLRMLLGRTIHAGELGDDEATEFAVSLHAFTTSCFSRLPPIENPFSSPEANFARVSSSSTNTQTIQPVLFVATPNDLAMSAVIGME